MLEKELKNIILQAEWPTYIEFKKNNKHADILWEGKNLYIIAN